MNFDRWTSPWSRTWQYRIFKAHHTQLNDMWWAHVVGSKAASKLASTYGAAAPTHSAFATAKHTTRGALSLGDWYGHYTTFDNWVHLSCAVSLCAYFEVYLSRIVALALRSDPGVLLSSSRSVDGVKLLKAASLPDVAPYVMSVTKGSWPNRIAAYERIFGVVPGYFQSQATELDNLRRLRNSVGHAFGRVGDEDQKFPAYAADPNMKGNLSREVIEQAHQPSSFQRLSDVRLKKWLGIVENSVNSIEEHLRTNHIGSFELLQAYHFWDKAHNIGHQSPHGSLKSMFEQRPSLEYCKQAITYYRRA